MPLAGRGIAHRVDHGAMAMLDGHPERHVWGLGRHYAGSNFFWYLKDPAGNFSEYYSDMDCIVDDQLWSPSTLEGAKGLFSWARRLRRRSSSRKTSPR